MNRTVAFVAGVAAALLACLSAFAGAAPPQDPFDTEKLRPPSPSSAWQAAPASAPCDPARDLPALITLVDAIDQALCRNPRTRESWAAAKVAAAQVGAARSATLPTVTGTVSAQSSDSRNVINSGRRDQLNGSLSFNYLLFDFGGRSAAIEQARQSLLAANWTHNATLQAVVLDTGQAYFQLFASDQAVEATQAAEKLALQSLEATRARQKAGTATRADVLQAQTAHSQAQLNRTQAEGDAAVARGTLSYTMGLPANAMPRLAPPADVDPRAIGESAVAALMDEALKRRPELRAAEANVAAAQSAVTVEQSAGKPSLSLFANPSLGVVNPGADPRSLSVGVTLNIPIFTGYQNTYRIQAARESVDRNAATRDRLRNDVSLEVWRSYQDVRTQGQALTTAGDLVRSATESYDVALGRYRAGVGNVIDLLSAQNALVQANIQRIQAQLRLNVSKVALARAIGVLEPSLFADAGAAAR